jgi:hypothetical protein
MINRDSRGRPYSIVRGEILGFIEDELLRKHSPRMFSLNHKLCRLGIGRWFFYAPFGTLREIKVFGLGGEYGRKAET